MKREVTFSIIRERGSADMHVATRGNKAVMIALTIAFVIVSGLIWYFGVWCGYLRPWLSKENSNMIAATKSLTVVGFWIAGGYALILSFKDTTQFSKMLLWQTVVFYPALVALLLFFPFVISNSRWEFSKLFWSTAFFFGVSWYRFVYGEDFEHIVSHLFKLDKYGIVLLYFLCSCLKYENILFREKVLYWICLRTFGVLVIFFFHTDDGLWRKWTHRGSMLVYAGILLMNAYAMDGATVELFEEWFSEKIQNHLLVSCGYSVGCILLLFLVFVPLNDLVGPLAEKNSVDEGTRLANAEPFVVTFVSELTLFAFTL